MSSVGTLLAPCEHNTDVLLAINVGINVGTANICVAGQFYKRVVGIFSWPDGSHNGQSPRGLDFPAAIQRGRLRLPRC